jgi:predicted alpha/beta hydrolase
MPSAARDRDPGTAKPGRRPGAAPREPVPEAASYEQRWLDRDHDRIGLQWYEPPPDPAAPVLLVWPAMGVPARFYRPFATALREAGLAVVVVDLRGTGASQPRASRASRYGYAELADDVGAVLAHLAPGRRVVLMGHSLGGQACVLHLARAAAPTVAGLALVAVGLPYWRSYQDRRRLMVLPFAQGVHAASTVLRVWPGWVFGGRQSRGVMRDWAYTARTGRFPALYGVDMEAALTTVRVPVLAVSLERDQYTPAPTVDHLVGKLTGAPVEREHYDGGVDHFSWARSPTPIATRVATFASIVARDAA